MPFRRSWEWDPDDVVPGLPPDHVVGVEAALWSETTRSFDDVTTLKNVTFVMKNGAVFKQAK